MLPSSVTLFGGFGQTGALVTCSVRASERTHLLTGFPSPELINSSPTANKCFFQRSLWVCTADSLTPHILSPLGLDLKDQSAQHQPVATDTAELNLAQAASVAVKSPPSK